MKKNVIPLLKCPYCDSPLNVQRIIEQKKDMLVWAILVCDCSSYPIVNGILLLQRPQNFQVLNSFTSTNFRGVIGKLFDQRKYYDRFLSVVHPYSLLSSIIKTLSGKDALSLLGYEKSITPLSLFSDSRDWARYLQTITSYGSEEVVSFLLSKSNKQINFLDLGSGVASYLRHHHTGANFICIDKSFTLLFLSKYFFDHNDASYICSDVDYGLPVQKKIADIMYANNAFTFFYKPKKILHEMLLATKFNGSLFIGDLHQISKAIPDNWFCKPPHYYIKNMHRSVEILDYASIVTSLRENKEISLRDNRLKDSTSLYALLIGKLAKTISK